MEKATQNVELRVKACVHSMEIILKYFSDFTPTQLNQLQALEPVYREWNEKINVISRKDIDGLYEKHVLHSLSIAAVFEFQPGSEILDLGTGGGFPGIPLAILFPEVKFHLADSIAKKLKVVEAVVSTTGLSNVTIQHTRAEEIKNKKFDFVVSRAVAPLGELWKWSKPLLRRESRPDGYQVDSQYPIAMGSALSGRQPATDTRPGLICLKGGDLAEETQQSGLRPYITDIYDIFPLEYFREKYILYVPR
ncbi:MAG TPA: 16S rRNA (guanine(527)-N(7))-methyltransferase RsmG [Chitinophagaceae bacterium]|nr:16S rRNA (guanine(527)-N(7))-methyltransferase RsmG [Chitinophagaceae bacterium]